MKKNYLTKIISDQMKTPPHFITTECWVKLKAVLYEIKLLLINKILKPSEIDTIKYFMDVRTNDIIDNCSAEDVYESITYIYSTIDWYLNKAVELELYEEAANLKHISELMMVKVTSN